MLIDESRAQLLIIDMQERLLPAMAEADQALKRAIILVKAARLLGLPITVSEQYPKGLGHTVASIKDEIGYAPVFEKLAFSAGRDEALAARLATNRRDQIVIGGIEAHVCVLQSALDLKAAGYQVYAAVDAITSRAPRSVSLALARMRDCGIAVVNTEMVVFEALGAAGTGEFKTLSALIR